MDADGKRVRIGGVTVVELPSFGRVERSMSLNPADYVPPAVKKEGQDLWNAGMNFIGGVASGAQQTATAAAESNPVSQAIATLTHAVTNGDPNWTVHGALDSIYTKNVPETVRTGLTNLATLLESVQPIETLPQRLGGSP